MPLVTPAADPAPPARARSWVALGGVWLASVAYLASRITRDWTPHDEGLLAQSAERLLAGQLPHRDFADAYTGLLTAYHAVAFAVGGHSLVTLRLALLVAFALWIPLYYTIVERFLGPLGAAVTTAAAVTWSVPNYSASMPSWYNLFLATAAAWAVIRYLDDPARRRWLVTAGIFAGLSTLVKIVGVYLIAGITLFLYWYSLGDNAPRTAGPAPTIANRAATVASVTVAALVSAGIIALVHTGMTSGAILHFAIPGAAIAFVLASAGVRSDGVRWREMLSALASFCAGVAIPVILFLVPFVAGHATDALLNGVFVAPLRRLVSATLAPQSFREAALALPIVAGVWASTRVRGPLRRYLWPSAIVLGSAVLVLSSHGRLYVAIVDAARTLVPVTACIAAVVCVPRRIAHSPRHQAAVLLTFVTVFFSFIQFPFAAAIYFCYVAPLALLAIVAITADVTPGIPAGVGGPLLAFVLCFGVWRMNTREYATLDVPVPEPKPTALLALPRGGLRVSDEDSATYSALIATVRAHATNEYMYCTPDCPEAYFLAGLKNPTPTTFEFLNDSAGERERTLRAIQEHRVGVVVLNDQFRFSAPDTTLENTLYDQYPDSAIAGYFTVLWRDKADALQPSSTVRLIPSRNRT